ncbi:hypothetical protein GA0115254_1088242 [Streptomyces sp. Ncost-T10-10d]|nr:hypothetical protein GA0115254_1088242 [Streptomyces sp. Ncost-T10-10d]
MKQVKCRQLEQGRLLLRAQLPGIALDKSDPDDTAPPMAA